MRKKDQAIHRLKPRRLLHCQRGRGHRLWLFTDADADYGYSQFYDSIDRILIGRKTYDQSLEFDEYPYKGKTKRCVRVYSKCKADRRSKCRVCLFRCPGICKETDPLAGQGHLACWRRGYHFYPAECWIGRRDHFIDSSHNPQQRHNTAVQGYTRQMKMKLTKSISCKSGLVQLWYEL